MIKLESRCIVWETKDVRRLSQMGANRGKTDIFHGRTVKSRSSFDEMCWGSVLCFLHKRFSPVLFWLTGITQVGLYAGTTRVRVLLDLCIWDLFSVSTAFLKWAASCKNVSSGTWGQRRPRSACTESLAAIESNNGEQRLEWNLAHAQDDVKPHILRMLEGTLLLDSAPCNSLSAFYMACSVN